MEKNVNGINYLYYFYDASALDWIFWIGFTACFIWMMSDIAQSYSDGISKARTKDDRSEQAFGAFLGAVLALFLSVFWLFIFITVPMIKLVLWLKKKKASSTKTKMKVKKIGRAHD